MDFKCKCCNYTTLVKSNYSKHIKSKKHLYLYTKMTPVIRQTEPESTQSQQKPTAYCCKYCDQVFKFKQSMYRHIKYTCTKSKDEDLKEVVRQMIFKIESEKKEREKEREKERKEFLRQLEKQQKVFMKQLQKQAKQIEKLMGKLEIRGSFNNNTINNYTLLAYRETDFSNITQEEIKLMLYKGNQLIKK